jgi:hypothetical protein
MNGLQPKSATDFFVLWHLRMISEALLQSGKSLREEHDCMEFSERVKVQAEITENDYKENFAKKKIAVLTRYFGLRSLSDN